MDTWIVEGPLGLSEGEKGRIEHEGWLYIESGALAFSKEPFTSPYIGYAPGQWLRFEKKEV